MPIRAAIFDLDDTLYLERDYVRSGYGAITEYLETRGLRPSSSAKALSIPAFLCRRLEQWLWTRFERGQAAGAFDELNSHFSLGLAKADIVELVKIYREHRPTIQPIPGTPELLSRLCPEYALGLLADGFLPAQRLKLAALGLERFFEAMVFTEELGRDAWKPSPVGFELMREKMEKLGTGPGLSYISDNPSKDFLAPNRLGWRTIQLVYPGQVHAHLPAPEGGRAQFVARLPGEVIEILKH